MTLHNENIIIDNDLNRLGNDSLANYVAHILCSAGQYKFRFNEASFTLKAGEAMIIRLQGMDFKGTPSADLQAHCIYLSPEYVELCTPRSNYGIRGTLALFANPIMQMNAEQFAVLQADFEQIQRRLANEEHGFKEDMMLCTVQMLFLDFFDIHASHNGLEHISHQDTDIMMRFLALLEQEYYIAHREVSFYAEQLFVSPKYLSQVSKRVSGQNALYWINRFTTIHLRKLLKAKELTLSEIAEQFGFSSMAYFTRFVQKNLGVNPSELGG